MTLLFRGILLLAVCAVWYLVFWCVAFRPEKNVPFWLECLLFLAALATGVTAIIWMVQGNAGVEKVRQTLPTGAVVAVGVIMYVVLLLVSWLGFHRAVTTELVLIVGWAVLDSIVINALYGSVLFSLPIAIVFGIVCVCTVIVSMYCYLIYYGLEKWKGYIDGMVPLILIAVVMAATAVAMAVCARNTEH